MKITIFAALAAVAAAKVQDNTHNVTYLGQKNLHAKTHGAIATTHYGNPLVGSCLSDETVMTVTGISGSFCSPPCHGGTICPSDVPQFCTATPECALNDGGTKYCALECSDSSSSVCWATTAMSVRLCWMCKTMLGAGLYSLAVLVGTKLSSLARHRHIPGG